MRIKSSDLTHTSQFLTPDSQIQTTTSLTEQHVNLIQFRQKMMLHVMFESSKLCPTHWALSIQPPKIQEKSFGNLGIPLEVVLESAHWGLSVTISSPMFENRQII